MSDADIKELFHRINDLEKHSAVMAERYTGLERKVDKILEGMSSLNGRAWSLFEKLIAVFLGFGIGHLFN